VKQRAIPRRKNFNSGENNDAINLNGSRIIKLITFEIVRNTSKKNVPMRDTVFFDPFVTIPLFLQKNIMGVTSKKRRDNTVNSPIVIKNLILK